MGHHVQQRVETDRAASGRRDFSRLVRHLQAVTMFRASRDILDPPCALLPPLTLQAQEKKKEIDRPGVRAREGARRGARRDARD